MNENKIQPRKALNKAFLKVKPNRNDIEKFKTLEKQIDQLVYELYGLTEEEIKIVESKGVRNQNKQEDWLTKDIR